MSPSASRSGHVRGLGVNSGRVRISGCFGRVVQHVLHESMASALHMGAACGSLAVQGLQLRCALLARFAMFAVWWSTAAELGLRVASGVWSNMSCTRLWHQLCGGVLHAALWPCKACSSDARCLLVLPCSRSGGRLRQS